MADKLDTPRSQMDMIFPHVYYILVVTTYIIMNRIIELRLLRLELFEERLLSSRGGKNCSDIRAMAFSLRYGRF